MSKFTDEFESQFKTTGKLKKETEAYKRANKERAKYIEKMMERFK